PEFAEDECECMTGEWVEVAGTPPDYLDSCHAPGAAPEVPASRDNKNFAAIFASEAPRNFRASCATRARAFMQSAATAALRFGRVRLRAPSGLDCVFTRGLPCLNQLPTKSPTHHQTKTEPMNKSVTKYLLSCLFALSSLLAPSGRGQGLTSSTIS